MLPLESPRSERSSESSGAAGSADRTPRRQASSYTRAKTINRKKIIKRLGRVFEPISIDFLFFSLSKRLFPLISHAVAGLLEAWSLHFRWPSA